MPILRVELNQKKDIVKFQFLYSMHQHLGWPRSNRNKPEEISIFTTKELLSDNKRIIENIQKWVSLTILQLQFFLLELNL